METEVQMKKKDVNIELLRICMCFFVIGIHLWGTYREWGGVFHPTVLFGNCMISCAVPVFFMITGYLFNANKPIGRYFKHLVVHILLPTIAVVFLSAVVMPYFLNIVSVVLGKSLTDRDETVSMIRFIKAVVTGNVGELPYCVHLWYIVDLVKCYILFPVLILLCREGKYEQRVRYLLLGLGFVFLVMTKTLEMFGLNIEAQWESPIGIYAWYLLLGYEIKVFFDAKTNKKRYLYGLGMYITSVLILYCLSYFVDYKSDLVFDKTYMDTSSLFCVVISVGIFMFLKYIPISECIEKIILTVGNKTFGIYLLHVIVYSVIWHLGIEKLIDYVGVPVFCLVFAGLTFAVTGVGVAIIKGIVGLLHQIKE